MTESASPSSGTDFVGRHAEVERLEAVWAAVESDRRQVVFVGGEPGVGKTRLVAEAAAALRPHATVLWGACREDLDIAYRPFVAILEQALEQLPPEVLTDIAPTAAAPLRRLTASVSRYWPTAEPIPGGPDSRPALFDAVLRVLLATAERRPLVLVLEDLHWAQEPTLAMLTHLVESTAGERLLVLATRRTTAPDLTDAVSFALADLHRLDGVARMDLVGLSTEDVAEYLVRAAGVSPGSARSAAPVLRDHTGGNPFFLQEYWHDLANRGGLAAVRSGVAAPRSVQDALARRLAVVDVDHARVIELAAVAGDAVDPALLADVLGSAEVLAGIDFGVRAGLLVADTDGEYRFAHALARQAVLDRMSSSDLTAAHAGVARAIEARDPALVVALAHHYFRARAMGTRTKRCTISCSPRTRPSEVSPTARPRCCTSAPRRCGSRRARRGSSFFRRRRAATCTVVTSPRLEGFTKICPPTRTPRSADGRDRARGRVVASLREWSAFAGTTARGARRRRPGP